MDINNNNINNSNDQNQQEYSADNTLNPRIPSYFQSLLTQPPLINPKTQPQAQTRFQGLKKLSTVQSGRGVLTQDVIFG